MTLPPPTEPNDTICDRIVVLVLHEHASFGILPTELVTRNSDFFCSSRMKVKGPPGTMWPAGTVFTRRRTSTSRRDWGRKLAPWKVWVSRTCCRRLMFVFEHCFWWWGGGRHTVKLINSLYVHVFTDVTCAVSHLLIGLVTFTAVDRHRDGGEISKQDSGWNGELSATVCRPLTQRSGNKHAARNTTWDSPLTICPLAWMLSRSVGTSKDTEGDLSIACLPRAVRDAHLKSECI